MINEKFADKKTEMTFSQGRQILQNKLDLFLSQNKSNLEIIWDIQTDLESFDWLESRIKSSYYQDSIDDWLIDDTLIELLDLSLYSKRLLSINLSDEQVKKVKGTYKYYNKKEVA